MDPADLRAALESHGLALERLGIEVRPPVVEPGATATEINEVEAQLGFSLPESFRRTLETLARSISWSWNAAGERFPAPFHQIFSGALQWSLDSLVEQHRGYLGWVENVFPDPDDEYSTVWHGKLGFSRVPNGDILAVDLAPERSGGIVYLSHDAGEGHGYLMAHSLMDLVNRWVPLACPGPEDWQWLPFVRYDLGPVNGQDDSPPVATRIPHPVNHWTV